jgi:quinoprotein glucose dehydrogenase
LASSNGDDAATLLSAWLDKLLGGQIPKELQLDVLEAARRSQSLVKSDSMKEKLAKYEAARDSHDPLAPWRECLFGGNSEEGRKAFFERQDTACLRCHKINGEGGEVGPDLAGLGQRQTREYILESILFPNKTIAPGFESAIITLKSGQTFAGIVKSETNTRLFINSIEDGAWALNKAEIQKREHALSPMPEGIADILSKRDLRDLIEFLATVSSSTNRTPAR